MSKIKLALNSQGDRKAIKFVVALFLLYLIFSQGNLFMNSIFSKGGKFYNQYAAENLNYVQGLRSALIVPSVWFIKKFGYYAIYNDSVVLVVNGPYMRINYSCLGLGVMSFLAAFVIAYPAKITDKLKIFILGILAIYLLNVSRISLLGLLMSHFKSQRDNFKYHHEVFNVFVYICIFLILYLWIKRVNRQPEFT